MECSHDPCRSKLLGRDAIATAFGKAVRSQEQDRARTEVREAVLVSGVGHDPDDGAGLREMNVRPTRDDQSGIVSSRCVTYRAGQTSDSCHEDRGERLGAAVIEIEAEAVQGRQHRRRRTVASYRVPKGRPQEAGVRDAESALGRKIRE